MALPVLFVDFPVHRPIFKSQVLEMPGYNCSAFARQPRRRCRERYHVRPMPRLLYRTLRWIISISSSGGRSIEHAAIALPIQAKYWPFNASKKSRFIDKRFGSRRATDATLTQYSATTDLDHWENPASFLVGEKTQVDWRVY